MNTDAYRSFSDLISDINKIENKHKMLQEVAVRIYTELILRNRHTSKEQARKFAIEAQELAQVFVDTLYEDQP